MTQISRYQDWSAAVVIHPNPDEEASYQGGYCSRRCENTHLGWSRVQD
jgi:hypothetical protein